MHSIFHASKKSSASIASAPVADAQSSQELVANPCSLEASRPGAGLPSASSRSGSGENEPAHHVDELRTKVHYYDSLFPKLDEHVKRYEAEIEQVRTLSIEKERQIDIQEAEIDRLRSAKTSLEHQVAELDEQVTRGEQRVDELVKVVNSLRSQNVSKDSQNVDLSDIARNALMDHLESENIRLTQEGLDQEKLLNVHASDHEHAVRRLEADHDAELNLMLHNLQEERATTERLTVKLEQVTREKARIEKDTSSKAVLEELDREARSKKQSKQLQDAIAYTDALGNSARLRQNGVEVEYHHMATLCRIAQAQEKNITRLSTATEQLKAENRRLERQFSNVPATAPSRSRTITFADELPLRADASNPTSGTTRQDATTGIVHTSRRRLEKRTSSWLHNGPTAFATRNAPSARIGPASHTTPTALTPSNTPETPSKRSSLRQKLRRSFSFGKAKTPVNADDAVE